MCTCTGQLDITYQKRFELFSIQMDTHILSHSHSHSHQQYTQILARYISIKLFRIIRLYICVLLYHCFGNVTLFSFGVLKVVYIPKILTIKKVFFAKRKREKNKLNKTRWYICTYNFPFYYFLSNIYNAFAPNHHQLYQNKPKIAL